MFYSYILKSQKTGRRYIGSTNNLQRRLLEHNSNLSNSTSHRGPYILEYYEEFQTNIEARKRETELKSYKGGNKLRELLDRAPR